MTGHAELAELVRTLVQQQTTLLQAHAEGLRMQHALIARLLHTETLSSASSSLATSDRSGQHVVEAPPSIEAEPAQGDRSLETGERAGSSDPPVLRLVGGTATRATRYYQEQPRTLTRAVTRQQIDGLKQVQDTGPAGGTVLQFGQYKGQTLGAIALTDPDYVRWLSLKAQRPQVREAARQVLASLSSRRQGLSARASTAP
jgi:hypothetical protein